MNRDATDLAGVRHRSYDALGSTNAEALALARAGERGPLWLSATQQTAGRGRRGREWVSEPGNLYATLLLSTPSAADVAPQLSFVAALAVHDAIVACAPALADRLRLKWPNDVLIGGAKVAGILIEAESSPVFYVAIGIGVNCVSHPLRRPISGDRSGGERSANSGGRGSCGSGSRDEPAARAMAGGRGISRRSAPIGWPALRALARGSRCGCRNVS